MKGLIGCLKRTQILCKAVIFSSEEKNPSLLISSFKNPISQITRRNYIAEMRKSAFEGNILRLLRSEIQYELEHSPKQSMTDQEQWISLIRKFGENEDIKVEATMFDGSIPLSKGGASENVQRHITLIVNISKGDGEVFEIMCSAWPGSIEITRLFIRKNDKMPAQPYFGPEFRELDDELQDSLYEFLEERGINEEFTAFLHGYMKNKDKTEFIKWMQTVKSYIEQK